MNMPAVLAHPCTWDVSGLNGLAPLFAACLAAAAELMLIPLFHGPRRLSLDQWLCTRSQP